MAVRDQEAPVGESAAEVLLIEPPETGAFDLDLGGRVGQDSHMAPLTAG